MMSEQPAAPAPEAWLSGPVAGVPPLLMPAAHALIGARNDLTTAAGGLSTDQLWDRPGGAASVGFHLRHIAGSLGRLYTYARGLPLTDAQRAALRVEGESGTPPAGAEALLDIVTRAVEEALDVLRSTRDDELLEFRGVGRAQLPSNTLGLLFHGAEHTQRHTGQVIATAKILRGR
jgi:uncharacterized damage-inducible protein DinB